jgi:hypothetical protein
VVVKLCISSFLSLLIFNNAKWLLQSLELLRLASKCLVTKWYNGDSPDGYLMDIGETTTYVLEFIVPFVFLGELCAAFITDAIRRTIAIALVKLLLILVRESQFLQLLFRNS